MPEVTSEAALWAPGDVVAWRAVWDGAIWVAAPAIVVQDEPDFRATYTLPGTGVMRPVDSNGNVLVTAAVRREGFDRHGEPPWLLEPRSSFNHILRLNSPGASHSVWLIWNDESWELICWYVNLEEPTTRTPVGFGSWDQVIGYSIDTKNCGTRGQWGWVQQKAATVGLPARCLARLFDKVANANSYSIQFGEPNPEVLSYWWPYWGWASYVSWCHRVY